MKETRYFPATLSLGHGTPGERAEGVAPDAKGRLPVALSSEFGVQRWTWDGEYTEVLEHTPEAVDLQRAALGRGLPLLLNHDSWGRDSFVGKVEDITVDKDRVMRGWMKFSQRQDAQDVKQEVLDGLRTSVSIGYQVTDTYESKEDPKTKGITRIYKSWIPLELSLVPIPADPTVGVGRSGTDPQVTVPLSVLNELRAKARAEDETTAETTAVAETTDEEREACPTCGAELLEGGQCSAVGCPGTAAESAEASAEIPADEGDRSSRKPARTRAAKSAARTAATAATPSNTESHMSGTNTPAAAAPAAPAAPDVQVVRAEIQKEASDRVRQYGEIARLANLGDEKVREWIEKETPVGVALSEARSTIATRADATKNGEPIVEVTAKDAKRYNFAKAILAQCQRGVAEFKHIDCGFEVEMAQEIRRKSPMLAARTNNMLIPSMMQSRTGLSSDEATKGETLKLTGGGEFIDLLRNKSVLMKAGARVISGLTGPLQLPRQTAAGTASWINENPGSDTSITEATLGSATLAMKSLISVSAYTRQMLIAAASGNWDVEQLIRDDMAAIFALALDAAGLKGGGSEEPTGIIAHTGTNVVTLGAQGGTLTYAKIIELETAVANQNGDSGKLAYIGRPSLRGFLKKLYAVNSTYGTVPVWTHLANDGDGLPQGVVNGYNAYATNQVPENFSPGTMTTTATALIFGDISQVIFGEWGAFETLVDENTLAAQAKVRVVSTQFVDVLVRQYQKLAVCKDINNSSL